MKIKIADRTLCKPKNGFSFKEKLEIARQLDKMGVDTIEIGKIENVKTDSLLIKTVASFVKGSVISVETGMSREGIDYAVAALSTAQKSRLRIELPVSTVGMEYTCHKKAPKMIETVADLVQYAKGKCQDVEFSALDATRAEKDVLVNIISAAIENGATSVTICDSAAQMMPDEFGKFVKEIADILGKDISFGISAVNTNGLAAANAVAAFNSGADTVKTDISGDSVPLDVISAIIKNCGDSCGFTSSVKYTEQNRILKQINWIISNAKNENGAVTVAKDSKNELSFTANDSKEAVISEVLRLGYDLSQEDTDKVYEEFLNVAGKLKNVGEKEIDAIIASVALQVPPTYNLVSYVINNGNIIASTAQITLKKDDAELTGISLGDGPIDSAFLAIEQIIGTHFELDDFQIQSVTEGNKALGSALVKLRHGGKLYSGNGISTDIIGASIRAYLSAVNKIVYEEA